MRLRMTSWIKHLQNEIVTSLEELEAKSEPSPLSDKSKDHQLVFKRDHWIRPEGGEGSSCILSNGRVLEKGGVNISIVHGMLPPAAIKQMRADHADMPEPTESLPFFAAGISLVLHPWNPHAPTVHLNYRYFEIDDPTSTAENPKPPLTSWFGGGTDLTPSYLYPEDAKHFHSTLQEACNQHHPSYFPTFKKWCDKYFYIPHRKETRGVGGIFFDDLSPSSSIHQDTQPDQEKIFSFVKTISSAFIPAYVPVLAKHKDDRFTEEERRWQLLRRGRYVEFNLVYDRGTKFGLMTPGARIESILMRYV
jgi:coproporphyrinogen III oxidase